ncbi:hypothetical protein [Chamaesiphon minutus]|uniref:Uncharacterized protein n=1 Tax=Chamaesiphon minutus (strain ATCC 27169 / PCC 6605) TaxID=1173020 RepID=K9UE07_CHAP6|nr:hypothetical protein [Chamaesiphon minutus]AFY92863.1 hypothetical protein Cha6605_1738 [Chamaesiphon minutus PCC 6605]
MEDSTQSVVRSDDNSHLNLNVGDIIKFTFDNLNSERSESLTVQVRLIHNSGGKVYYYLDLNGLIVPTEDNAEYYLTGDRFYLSLELERWQFNVTKVYCEDNAPVSYPFRINIFDLEIIRRS